MKKTRIITEKEYQEATNVVKLYQQQLDDKKREKLYCEYCNGRGDVDTCHGGMGGCELCPYCLGTGLNIK